ncbi:MAG: hypothetical protein EXQ84_03895 [Rhodospirillaceae bacterium]|nr:hypothetical protein [Rhodospirillaceae bacterium]
MVVRISKSTIQQKISVCALIAILINNLSHVNERYSTTNTVAEKLLNDLKAAQGEKVPEADPGATVPAPAAPDPKGSGGKHGAAP